MPVILPANFRPCPASSIDGLRLAKLSLLSLSAVDALSKLLATFILPLTALLVAIIALEVRLCRLPSCALPLVIRATCF